MNTSKSKHKTNKGFAERLRQLRKQKNFSQVELGEVANIHFTHISRYERGISLPAVDTLQRLALVLGVTGDYLLDGNEDEVSRTIFENRDFLLLFKEIEKLPQDDQTIIRKVIEAFLSKSKIRELVNS